MRFSCATDAKVKRRVFDDRIGRRKRLCRQSRRRGDENYSQRGAACTSRVFRLRFWSRLFQFGCLWRMNASKLELAVIVEEPVFEQVEMAATIEQARWRGW